MQDLNNEPHGRATWGESTAFDWHTYIQQAVIRQYALCWLEPADVAVRHATAVVRLKLDCSILSAQRTTHLPLPG
jgi:hypothetical protein